MCTSSPGARAVEPPLPALLITLVTLGVWACAMRPPVNVARAARVRDRFRIDVLLKGTRRMWSGGINYICGGDPGDSGLLDNLGLFSIGQPGFRRPYCFSQVGAIASNA